MTGNPDRFASGDPPLFAPAPGLPVVPAIPVHLAAVAGQLPTPSSFCPVCVVVRSVGYVSLDRCRKHRSSSTISTFTRQVGLQMFLFAGLHEKQSLSVKNHEKSLNICIICEIEDYECNEG